MGSAQSAEAEGLLFKKKGDGARYYNLPDAREKTRYEPEENIPTTSSYEASIDKFDYLIVFPLTENKSKSFESPIIQQMANGVQQGAMKLLPFGKKNDWITWKEIKETWHHVSFGTDEDRESAVRDLSEFWALRTGSMPEDKDRIRMKAWYTVAREAILKKLTTTSGLQFKLTANSKFIFCRVRAPLKLLEIQADKLDYRLQFKGEIDPGSEEFWNRELLVRDENDNASYVAVELEEERKMYTREEAVRILEKLYKAGKISPNELGIKDENQTQWSLRIHALERIVDKVPVSNVFPAHGDFCTKPEKRHLYNTYPTVRGRTLFRFKDRILLTKSILDGYFDLEVLQSRKVINSIFALHDANRGEKITKDILKSRWVTFWGASAQEVGTPFVSHPAYEEGSYLSWYWRPFSQPLGDIRDYFGEKIALYFAWFSYYTCCISVLFLFSIGFYIVIISRGFEDMTDGLDWWSYFYFLIVLVWSEIYQMSWARENEAIKVKWGTSDFEETEKVRPQFVGMGPLVRSQVDNNKMAVFPREVRSARIMSSYMIIFLLIVLNLTLIAGIYIGEYLLVVQYPILVDESSPWSTVMVWGQSVLHAFVLQTNAVLFPKFVKGLNDYENYRTDSTYEDALITKTLVFQVTNNFAAATFTTFGKELVFGDCAGGSCIGDLRILLIAIILVRMFRTIWRLIKPLIYGAIENVADKASHLAGGHDHEDDEESGGGLMNSSSSPKNDSLNLAEDIEDDKEFMEELQMSPYEGTFQDYSESCLQFGFVSLFSVAMPLLAVYALFENFFILRVNAWRLCALHRRPHVVLAEDVGSWTFFIRFLSFMGPVWGLGIIFFAGPNFLSTDGATKAIYFLASVQTSLYLKVVLSMILNTSPDWVIDLKRRNDYVVQKYYVGHNDDDENLTLDALKGVIDDHVDVDSLNLYDLRKGIKITEAEYRAMNGLEAKRRMILKEVKSAKDALQIVYKTETFNENTGIGETKFGLPLGRLNVKLIQIEDLKGAGLEDLKETGPRSTLYGRKGEQQQIQVRVSIRATRKGTQAAPPFGDLSDSEIHDLEDGKAQIDQIMGPYAPIRTIDAEVIFDILNVNEDLASVAVGSVSLRELQDQEPHDISLPLKVRLPNGDISSAGRLYINTQFQFSKVLPVRRRIYDVQGRLREVEHELALIKAGKKTVNK